MSFRQFPEISIHDKTFDEDVKPLIREIRPHWDVDCLKSKQFTLGISNLLFGVYADEIFTDKTDMILVRIYGESLFDRDLELENMTALSKLNLSASVWGKFENGCAYQYIHGTLININQIREDPYKTLIIAEFAKMHAVKININRPKEPFLFPKMRELAADLPEQLDNPEANERYLEHFPSKSVLAKEIECLELHLVKPTHPVTFCHNDVLVHNLILNKNGDRIHFIDFEYAGYNYTAFDIGNHFNEFAGLETVDYSLYPDEVFQKKWIRQYLEICSNISESNGHGNGEDKPNIDENDINHWYKMINKFSLASHLLWCMWSIRQVRNSSITFDYTSYGILRWKEYQRRKDEFLEL